MSQSQGNEARRLSRRTIATGAAWAVPVIAVGAAVPAMASSPPCQPTFTVIPEQSSKCCNGAVKNMKLVIKITDDQNCIDNTASICITGVVPSTPNVTIGKTVFDGPTCTTEGGKVTVYLLDVSNCTVNLLVQYQIAGGSVQVAALKSGNIPTGNSDAACEPPA